MADVKLLEKLCCVSGAPGREDEVRALILREIEGLADEIKIDPLGSILAFKKGKKRPAKKVLLDAHMDEVAFMITGVTEEGLLRYTCLGGMDGRVQCGIQVRVGDVCIPGITGLKPVHLCDKKERDAVPEEDARYIDIGARDREDALRQVWPGDIAVFAPHFECVEDRVLAKALDDRAGCAVLIELMRAEQEYDLHYTFTVQEEVGLRGARAAAYTVAPDAAIAIEATTAADIAGVSKDKRFCALGGGAVVTFMDGHTVYDRACYDMAFACAREKGIPAQPKAGVAGGNNAGAIHTTRGGVRTLSLSLPCRYIHAPVGVIDMKDYEAVLALTSACAARMAETP